jgi:hypothetical protein
VLVYLHTGIRYKLINHCGNKEGVFDIGLISQYIQTIDKGNNHTERSDKKKAWLWEEEILLKKPIANFVSHKFCFVFSPLPEKKSFLKLMG